MKDCQLKCDDFIVKKHGNNQSFLILKAIRILDLIQKPRLLPKLQKSKNGTENWHKSQEEITQFLTISHFYRILLKVGAKSTQRRKINNTFDNSILPTDYYKLH